MSQPSQDEDKQFDPTEKKLEDARKKGEIPRSSDMNNAAAYAGFVFVATAFGMYILSGLSADLSRILADAPDLAADIFNGGSRKQLGAIGIGVVGWASPWFAVPALASIVAIIAQKSFIFTPSKIQPKISRISVLSNAKNKFGRQGLFEFLKSFTKLLIYSTVLGIFLVKRTPEMAVLVDYSPTIVTAFLAETALSFIYYVLVVAALVGVVDFFWQQAEHIRKNRMSRKEIQDEVKQMEGDPYIKQKRRQKGQEIAMNQMLADVPTADVVIVNPKHFAVALKWSRAPGSAPICIAKGVDEIAARIREAASEFGVPIHRDPPTARSLFATVNLGEQIPTDQYRAVAAAIRFAENMGKRKIKKRPQM
ncbi:MAG: flagellar type III secretion system protein FlhB [Paracoccaceae bacterium]